MITIKQVDTWSKKEVNEFVQFPFSLYKNVNEWVPPIVADIKLMLNKNKHPFYEHSDADFFTARENGEMVGRIACIENKKYNQYHDKKDACFYLFECIDDQSVAEKLFDRASDWANDRVLDVIIGPKGLSTFDGYGFLIEGFDKRQMMTMMNYNLPNYPKFAEALGFTKVVDWVSSYMNIPDFNMPEKVKIIAKRVEEKGKFKVLRFSSKKELKKWSWKIGQAYNNTFVNNWEYYPLSDNEIKFIMDNIMVVAVPDLLKVITYNDEVIGFLFAFPDISAALQKHHGKLSPLALVSYLRELKKTDWISFNGVGVLPEYHGRGGNVLMFSEIYKTANAYNFKHGELTNVAETATQMRKDLENLGVTPYKNHRIYSRKI
jgi:GNAT superfamily N-acetyltransferase